MCIIFFFTYMPFDGESNPYAEQLIANPEGADKVASVSDLESLAKTGGTKAQLEAGLAAIDQQFQNPGLDAESIKKLATLSGEIRTKLLDTQAESGAAEYLDTKVEAPAEAEPANPVDAKVAHAKERIQALIASTKDRIQKRKEITKMELDALDEQEKGLNDKYDALGIPPDDEGRSMFINGIQGEKQTWKQGEADFIQKRTESLKKMLQSKLEEIGDVSGGSAEAAAMMNQIKSMVQEYSIQTPDVAPPQPAAVQAETPIAAMAPEASNTNVEVPVAAVPEAAPPASESAVAEQPASAAPESQVKKGPVEWFQDTVAGSMKQIDKFKGTSMDQETRANEKQKVLAEIKRMIKSKSSDASFAGRPDRFLNSSSQELSNASNALDSLMNSAAELGVSDSDLENIKQDVLSVQQGTVESGGNDILAQKWSNERDALLSKIDASQTAMRIKNQAA